MDGAIAPLAILHDHGIFIDERIIAFPGDEEYMIVLPEKKTGKNTRIRMGRCQ
jgi:hypothetical protein